MTGVTQILASIEQGDPHAAEQLLPLVYEELRKLAAARMGAEAPDHTLQATALVHEAWLRLVGNQHQQHWDSRGHFFSAAAEAMRRILVEGARRRQRVRHGGERQRVPLDDLVLSVAEPPEELLALDEALTKLAAIHPQRAELVRLRYFAGLTIDEAAQVLGVSATTADRYWTYARAWLYREIAADDPPGTR